ncbi:hypothetical protein ACLKA7_005476 [Drosophila subpalustris]
MSPTTRSQAANPGSSALESESLQGAVGGAWSQTGTIPKPRLSDLPIPEKLDGQPSNAEKNPQAAGIPSEIKSAINVALFQAQETYRTAMSTQFSELQAEIRREMLGFMMEIQETVRSTRQVDPAPAKQLEEPAKTFVPPVQGSSS